MQLRLHPGLYVDGRRTWPPKWTTTEKDKTDRPWGEIGTLKEVLFTDLFDTECFLVIEHNGRKYMGALTCRDAKACVGIVEILKKMIDLSTKEIGDLQLPYDF